MIHKAYMVRGDEGVSGQPMNKSSEALTVLNSRRAGMKCLLT